MHEYSSPALAATTSQNNALHKQTSAGQAPSEFDRSSENQRPATAPLRNQDDSSLREGAVSPALAAVGARSAT